MSYSIKVLSNKEFEDLPYEHAKIALGAADVTSGTVYVRNTHISELNDYLISHELDHLVEDHATDEIDGIRYKIPLIGALPGLIGGIGGLAAKALPAIGSFASKALPVIGGAAKGVGNALLPGNPFGGGSLASGIGSAVKTAGNVASIASMLPKSPKPGYYVSNNGQGFGAPQQANIQMPFDPNYQTNFLNQQLAYQNSQQPKSFSYSGWGQPDITGVSGQQPPSAGFLDSLMDTVKTGAGGMTGLGEKAGNLINQTAGSIANPQSILGGSMLAAGLNKDLPSVPPLPQSAENLRSRVNAGGGELSQAAKLQLNTLLGQQFDPLTEPEIQAALRQLEREQMLAEDRTRDLYRNLRPGSDPSSDTTFRRDLQEVSDQFSRAKADTLATRTRDLKQNFDTQRMQQIQQALGADQQDMQNLVMLAQMDIDQIMAQLGIDFASAQHFKETFSQLGSNLILQGAGVPTLNLIGAGR